MIQKSPNIFTAKMNGKEYYNKFCKELNQLSNSDLIKEFNREVGINGWTTARASFLAAIHSEFNRREFDYSEIGDAKSLSFKNKVVLNGSKITIANIAL
jgi:hypothetical protein